MFLQYVRVCKIIVWQSHSESICGHSNPLKQHIKSKIHFTFLKEMAKKRLWKLEGICCATHWNKNKVLPAIPPKHDIWYSFHLATSSLTSHLNQASTLHYPHPSHHPIIPSRYWCTNVKRVMSWSIWASLAISRWSTLSTCSNCAWTWSSSGVGADSLVAKTRNWELLQKVGTMSGHPTSGVTTCDNPNSFRLSEWLWILQTFGVCH